MCQNNVDQYKYRSFFCINRNTIKNYQISMSFYIPLKNYSTVLAACKISYFGHTLSANKLGLA